MKKTNQTEKTILDKLENDYVKLKNKYSYLFSSSKSFNKSNLNL